MAVVMVDIDGTICREEKTFDRPLAVPLPGAAEGIRRLRAAGHVVVLWTARGWEQLRTTEDWLRRHGFEWDGLLMGKPVADIYIDDRGRRFKGWDEDYGEGLR